MISWKMDTGTPNLSPGAKKLAQHLDSAANKHSGTIRMVADPDLPGWMTGNGRRGDVCEISTKTGRLVVCISGEKAALGCVVS